MQVPGKHPSPGRYDGDAPRGPLNVARRFVVRFGAVLVAVVALALAHGVIPAGADGGGDHQGGGGDHQGGRR